VKKIRTEVMKALSNLSSEGPEPRYLLVEERHLRGLVESLELAAGAKRLEVIKESIIDEKKYIEELIKESLHDTKEYLKTLLKDSDSLSFEEKATLLERLSNRKSTRLADSEERSKSY